MKAWKIDLSGYTGKVREVVSEAVQKKAFELGYDWNGNTRTVCHAKEPYLFFYSACITFVGKTDHGYFLAQSQESITAADFLELTADKVNEPTFKPFDRVLVRDSDGDSWKANLFSHFANNRVYCAGGWYFHCIPYEGNEHLVGTTDSAK